MHPFKTATEPERQIAENVVMFKLNLILFKPSIWIMFYVTLNKIFVAWWTILRILSNYNPKWSKFEWFRSGSFIY